MLRFKPLKHSLLTILALLSMGAAETTLSRSSSAQQPRPSRQSQFGGFFAPKGKAMPQDSAGGASRGECPMGAVEQDANSTVIRLMTPQGNSGLSASAHPVFLAYVDSQVAQRVYFSIKNEDESYFYEKTLPPTYASQGLWKFQLPEDAPPLELGDRYKWSVALVCSSQFGPDSPWASGWIQRTEAPELEIEQAQPSMELASAYGKAGLWYDTAAVLFELKAAERSAAAEAAWQQLLLQGGLQRPDFPIASSQRASAEQ